MPSFTFSHELRWFMVRLTQFLIIASRVDNFFFLTFLLEGSSFRHEMPLAESRIHHNIKVLTSQLFIEMFIIQGIS